jgi:hypothetical protein
MMSDLSKVDSNFRQINDTLLFSDRTDLDLSNFTFILNKNKYNIEYFWDSFKKASELFWENNEDLWFYRFSFFLKNLDRNILRNMEMFLEKRMFALLLLKNDVSPKVHLEYIQFLQYFKVKSQRGESLSNIKDKFIDLVPKLKIKKAIYVLNSMIPSFFKDKQEFFDLATRKILASENNFNLLLELERQGVVFDRAPVINLANEIILELEPSERNARTLFFLLKDSKIMEGLKQKYSLSHHSKILTLINECYYQVIEDNHLINIKNLVQLDSSIADELANIYAKKIFNRVIAHKRANSNRIIRLLKSVPEISHRKLLAFMAANNQMSDIRYITKVFPELKKLAIFV